MKIKISGFLPTIDEWEAAKKELSLAKKELEKAAMLINFSGPIPEGIHLLMEKISKEIGNLIDERSMLKAEVKKLQDEAAWIPTSAVYPDECDTVLIVVNGKTVPGYWKYTVDAEHVFHKVWFFLPENDDNFYPLVEDQPEVWKRMPAPKAA